MAKHDVTLDLHTKIVAHKNVEVMVRSDGSKLGTLLVSKGNVEGLAANNSDQKYRLDCECVAQLVRQPRKDLANK